MLTLKNKHRSSKHPGKGKLALQQISIRNPGGSEEYVVTFAQVISAQNLQHKRRNPRLRLNMLGQR
jgi:hypothetical protein